MPLGPAKPITKSVISILAIPDSGKPYEPLPDLLWLSTKGIHGHIES